MPDETVETSKVDVANLTKTTGKRPENSNGHDNVRKDSLLIRCAQYSVLGIIFASVFTTVGGLHDALTPPMKLYVMRPILLASGALIGLAICLYGLTLLYTALFEQHPWPSNEVNRFDTAEISSSGASVAHGRAMNDPWVATIVTKLATSTIVVVAAIYLIQCCVTSLRPTEYMPETVVQSGHGE